MGRAFREGVAPERRVVTQKRDLRFELAIGDGRLSHLWNRATKSQQASNQDGQVPAMITIEDGLPDLVQPDRAMGRQQPPLANPMGWVEIQVLTVTDAWATTPR